MALLCSLHRLLCGRDVLCVLYMALLYHRACKECSIDLLSSSVDHYKGYEMNHFASCMEHYKGYEMSHFVLCTAHIVVN